ncbi:MAG: winged helix DNA-binding protein [Bifidobacteriaceae bacterium]|jgi:DNA-binding MarR family transcriptional regulator|nr:winged helix DNA-binding protein [Bifidobacteriaceae bacterium]MCI1915153.1 winged helix DNA-binding protein [Bifidobacteriaceae bacterium]
MNTQKHAASANDPEIRDLAIEFVHLMPKMHRTDPQKRINESMRGEHFIVQYIQMQGRKVQPSEISTEMEISSARVAAALNGLEKKGLIKREIDPSDRRRILVGLTDEGSERAQEISEHMVDSIRELFASLGLEDSRELVRLIGRVADFMKEHHGDLPKHSHGAHEAAARGNKQGDDQE